MLFADETILGFQDSTHYQRLLILINIFRKLHTDISRFIHRNNEQQERGIEENIPFSTSFNNSKQAGINLTKAVKDLHNEISEMQKQRNKQGIRRSKLHPCSWTGRTNIVKCCY